MDGNRDDAERCLQLAENALRSNDLPKARRLYEKSCRMFPLPDLQPPFSANLSAAETASNRTKKPAPAAPSRPKAPEEPPPPPKEPTADMVASVRAVHNARDKTHYKVLGLETDADDTAIKKAYRRLALKLHPDRNCAPGADEAFKRVSQAFMTLSDAERRAHYDRFGTDDPAQPPPRPRRARRRRGGARGHGGNFDDFAMHQEMTPDELFEFLFQAAAADPQFHRARAEGSGREESFWEKFKPIILLFAVILFAMFLSQDGDGSAFSLHRTAYHTVRRATGSDVTYFIPKNLDLSSLRTRRRLDDMVDRTAFEEFMKKCTKEREHAAYLLARSNRWLSGASVRQEYREKFVAFERPWCARAAQLRDRLERKNYRW